MANTIYRGSTCRIQFKPKNVDISLLGDPSIVISQEYAYVTPTVYINEDDGIIFADLSQDDTIQLVEYLETKAQLIFYNNDTKSVTRFPVHQVNVEPTIAWILYENEEEAEPEVEEEEPNE